MKIVTSCPSFASAFGSDPHTSPNPPVFAIGETSAVAKRIFISANSILRRCHPEPPKALSAKRGTPQDGRRTPFLVTRKGGRRVRTRRARWGVLRPSSAAPAAPTELRRLRMTELHHHDRGVADHVCVVAVDVAARG